MSTGKIIDALSDLKRSKTELETRIANAYTAVGDKHLSDYAPPYNEKSLDDLITRISHATNFGATSLPAKSKLKLQPNMIPYGKVVPDSNHPGEFLYGANAYPDLGRAYKMRPTQHDMAGDPVHISFIPNYNTGVHGGVLGWYYVITTEPHTDKPTSYLYQYTIYTNESYPTIKEIKVQNALGAVSDIKDCWIVPFMGGDPESVNIAIFEKTATGNKKAYPIRPTDDILDIDYEDSTKQSAFHIVGENLLSCTHTAFVGTTLYAWNDSKGYIIKFDGVDIECAALAPDSTGGVMPTPSCIYRDNDGLYCVVRNKGTGGSNYSTVKKYHDEALTNQDSVWNFNGEATTFPNHIVIEQVDSSYHKNEHSPFSDRKIWFASTGAQPGSYLNGKRTNPTLANVLDCHRFGDFVFGATSQTSDTNPFYLFFSGSNLLSRPLTVCGSALLITEEDGGVEHFPGAQIVVDDEGLRYTFGDTLSHQKNVDMFAGIEEILFQKRVTPESPNYFNIGIRNLAYPNVWPYIVNGEPQNWYYTSSSGRYSGRAAFIDVTPSVGVQVHIPWNQDTRVSMNRAGLSGIYDVLIIMRSDLPDYQYTEPLGISQVDFYNRRINDINSYESAELMLYQTPTPLKSTDRNSDQTEPSKEIAVYHTKNSIVTSGGGEFFTYMGILNNSGAPHCVGNWNFEEYIHVTDIAFFGYDIVQATPESHDKGPTFPGGGIVSGSSTTPKGIRTLCVCDISAIEDPTTRMKDHVMMLGGQVICADGGYYPLIFFVLDDSYPVFGNIHTVGPGPLFGSILHQLPSGWAITNVCGAYAKYKTIELAAVAQSTNVANSAFVDTTGHIPNGPQIILANLSMDPAQAPSYVALTKASNKQTDKWYSDSPGTGHIIIHSLTADECWVHGKDYGKYIRDIVVTDIVMQGQETGDGYNVLTIIGTGLDVRTNRTMPFVTHSRTAYTGTTYPTITLGIFQPDLSCLPQDQSKLLSSTFTGTLPGSLSTLRERIQYGMHGVHILQPRLQITSDKNRLLPQMTMSAHLQADPTTIYSRNLALQGNPDVLPSLLPGQTTGYKILSVAYGTPYGDVKWVAVGYYLKDGTLDTMRGLILTSKDGNSWERCEGFYEPNSTDHYSFTDVKYISFSNAPSAFYAVANGVDGLSSDMHTIFVSYNGDLWLQEKVSIYKHYGGKAYSLTRQNDTILLGGWAETTTSDTKKDRMPILSLSPDLSDIRPIAQTYLSELGIPGNCTATLDGMVWDTVHNTLIAVINTIEKTTNEHSFYLVKSENGTVWTNIGISSTEGTLNLGHHHISNMVFANDRVFAVCNTSPLPSILTATNPTDASSWTATPIDTSHAYGYADASGTQKIQKLGVIDHTCFVLGSVEEADGIIRPTMGVFNGTKFTPLYEPDQMRNMCHQTMFEALGISDDGVQLVAFFSEGAQTDLKKQHSRWIYSALRGKSWKYYSQIQILDTVRLHYSDGTSEIMCVGKCLNFGIPCAYWTCSKDEGVTWIDMVEKFGLLNYAAKGDYRRAAHHCYYPCISPLQSVDGEIRTGAAVGLVYSEPVTGVLQSDMFYYIQKSASGPGNYKFSGTLAPVSGQLMGSRTIGGLVYCYGIDHSVQGSYPWFGISRNISISKQANLPTGTDFDPIPTIDKTTMWTQYIAPGNSVVWTGREFVAVTSKVTDGNNRIFRSVCGSNWSAWNGDMPSEGEGDWDSAYFQAVATHNDITLIFGRYVGSGFIKLATPGEEWINVTPSSINPTGSHKGCGWNFAFYESGAFYAGGELYETSNGSAKAFVIKSLDGVNWDAPHSFNGGDERADTYYWDMTYNPKRKMFLAIGKTTPATSSIEDLFIKYGTDLDLRSTSTSFTITKIDPDAYYTQPLRLTYGPLSGFSTGILVATGNVMIHSGGGKSFIATQLNAEPQGEWQIKIVSSDSLYQLSKPHYHTRRGEWIVLGTGGSSSDSYDKFTSNDGVTWHKETIFLKDIGYPTPIPTGVFQGRSFSNIVETETCLLYATTYIWGMVGESTGRSLIFIKETYPTTRKGKAVITCQYVPTHEPIGIYATTPDTIWMPINYKKYLDPQPTLEVIRYTPNSPIKWKKFLPIAPAQDKFAGYSSATMTVAKYGSGSKPHLIIPGSIVDQKTVDNNRLGLIEMSLPSPTQTTITAPFTETPYLEGSHRIKKIAYNGETWVMLVEYKKTATDEISPTYNTTLIAQMKIPGSYVLYHSKDGVTFTKANDVAWSSVVVREGPNSGTTHPAVTGIITDVIYGFYLDGFVAIGRADTATGNAGYHRFVILSSKDGESWTISRGTEFSGDNANQNAIYLPSTIAFDSSSRLYFVGFYENPTCATIFYFSDIKTLSGNRFDYANLTTFGDRTGISGQWVSKILIHEKTIFIATIGIPDTNSTHPWRMWIAKAEIPANPNNAQYSIFRSVANNSGTMLPNLNAASAICNHMLYNDSDGADTLMILVEEKSLFNWHVYAVNPHSNTENQRAVEWAWDRADTASVFGNPITIASFTQHGDRLYLYGSSDRHRNGTWSPIQLSALADQTSSGAPVWMQSSNPAEDYGYATTDNLSLIYAINMPSYHKTIVCFRKDKTPSTGYVSEGDPIYKKRAIRPFPAPSSKTTLPIDGFVRYELLPPTAIRWDKNQYQIGLNYTNSSVNPSKILLTHPIVSIFANISDYAELTDSIREMTFDYFRPTHSSIDYILYDDNRYHLIGSSIVSCETKDDVSFMASSPRMITTTEHTDTLEYQTFMPTNGDMVESIRGIAYNGSTWVAVGGSCSVDPNDRSTHSAFIFYSYDGIQWNIGKVTAAQGLCNYSSVIYAKQLHQFIAVGDLDGGANLAFSPNGEDWVELKAPDASSFGYPPNTKCYDLRLGDFGFGNVALIGRVGSSPAIMLYDANYPFKFSAVLNNCFGTYTTTVSSPTKTFTGAAYGNNKCVLVASKETSDQAHGTEYDVFYSAKPKGTWRDAGTKGQANQPNSPAQLIFAEGKFLFLSTGGNQSKRLSANWSINGSDWNAVQTNEVTFPNTTVKLLHLAYESGIYIMALEETDIHEKTGTKQAPTTTWISVLTSQDGFSWKPNSSIFSKDAIFADSFTRCDISTPLAGAVLDQIYLLGGIRSTYKFLGGSDEKLERQEPFIAHMDLRATRDFGVPIVFEPDRESSLFGGATVSYNHIYNERLTEKKRYTCPYLLDFDQLSKPLLLQSAYLYQKSHRTTMAYPLKEWIKNDNTLNRFEDFDWINFLMVTHQRTIRSSVYASKPYGYTQIFRDIPKGIIRANADTDDEPADFIVDAAHVCPRGGLGIPPIRVIDKTEPNDIERHDIAMSTFAQAISTITMDPDHEISHYSDIYKLYFASYYPKRVPLPEEDSFFTQTIAPIALDKINVPYFKLTI